MTQPPSWVTEVDWAPVHPTTTPATQFTPLFTDQQLEAIGQNFIEGIIKQVILSLLGILAPGTNWQNQLGNWADEINNINNTLNTIFGDLANGDVHGALTSLQNSINTTIGGWLTEAKNIFGQLRLDLLPLIPASHVINVTPELLWAATFDTAASIQGTSGFAWDGTVDHTGTAGSGSAKCTANGTLERIISNSIPVIITEDVNVSVWVRWSGVTASGSSPPPIHLDVYPYAGGVAQPKVTIASVGSPASSSGWVQLSGAYVVPLLSGIDSINIVLAVDSTATAGSVWFDDASAQKPGLLAAGQTLTDHANAFLTHLFGSNTLGANLQYPLLPNISIGAIGNDIQSHIQAFVDAISNALGHAGTAHSTANIQSYLGLGSIPNANLTNVLGGLNLGADLNALATTLFGSPVSAGTVRNTIIGNVLGGANLGADLNALATNLFGSPTAGTTVQYPALPTFSVGGVSNDIQSHISGLLSGIVNAFTGGTSTITTSGALPAALANIPHTNVTLPPNPGSGTITHDATANNNAAGSTYTLTVTCTPTVAVAADYLIVRINFYCAAAQTSNVASNVVYGTGAGQQQMQLLASTGNSTSRIYSQIWGVPNPTAGANTVTAAAWVTTTLSTVNTLFVQADSYIGVSGVGTTAATTGSNSSPTHTVASTSNNFIVQTFTVSGAATETLSSYNQTQRYNTNLTTQAVIGGDAAGAASVTFSATASYTASNVWNSVAVSLAPLPAAAIGSGFRQLRTLTGTTTVSTGNNTLPASFFDTAGVSNTSDYTYTSTTNTVTVTYAGWYAVTINILATTISGTAAYHALLYQNGSLVASGPGALQTGGSWAGTFGGTFLVYCSANDTLAPGYNASTAGINLTGEATGTQCYFEVALCNRSPA